MKPWYQSLTMKALIVSALTHLLVVLGVADDIASKSVTDFVEGALPFVGLISDAIAAYGRARAKAPLAASKTDAARSLVVLAMLAPVLAVLMTGCTGTQAAYKEAQGVDEQAYVAVEHYASLLREANELKGKATTPGQAIVAMQTAAAKAQPVVMRVKDLRDAYAKVRNAENEAQLQEAVDEAILLIADLVRSVNQARGEVQ